MTIRTAQLEDTAALVRLWNACFIEDERFMTEFFRYRYKPYHALLAQEDGLIVSALHIVPYELLIDARIFSASFIVGAGTLPAYRGRGLMSRLLDYVKKNTRSDFVALYPADRAYYASRGFTTASYTNRYELKDRSGPDAVIVPADTDDINGVYNNMILRTGGGLVRDLYAWYFYLLDYKTLCVKTDTGYGYAVIKDSEAVEAAADDGGTGEALLSKLYAQGVRHIQAVPGGLIDQILSGQSCERVAQGMIAPQIDQTVYISEMY